MFYTMPRKKTKSKKEQPTVTQLKKKLDAIYSQYIRRKYSDYRGYCSCVTCGVSKHVKHMQCGHYVPRTHLSLRYDERNTFPQCASCNVFQKGRMDEYAIFLINKFGDSILNELNIEKHKITKNFPYEEKIRYYKEKLLDMPDVPEATS